MLNNLKLGNKIFSTNLIQGPLAGVSCAPFRRLIWKYSQPAFTYTEMISCKTVLHQSTLTQKRFISKHPQEGPLGVQLAGNHPDEIGEATKRVTDYGVDLVDLNCGCPVKKIRNKGAGSKLLSDAIKLYQLVSAMKKNTHLPVSIKIRVDGTSNDHFNLEIVKVIKDAGVDFLIVHGRHWTEKYETPCHYNEISFFVNELSIPVIGNGDINCSETLKKMFSTRCAGVMISRGSVGRPWLISELIATIQQTPFQIPSRNEIIEIFIEHISTLSSLLNNEKFAIYNARKLAKYYARNIDISTKQVFFESINECINLKELKKLCLQHFT